MQLMQKKIFLTFLFTWAKIPMVVFTSKEKHKFAPSFRWNKNSIFARNSIPRKKKHTKKMQLMQKKNISDVFISMGKNVDGKRTRRRRKEAMRQFPIIVPFLREHSLCHDNVPPTFPQARRSWTNQLECNGTVQENCANYKQKKKQKQRVLFWIRAFLFC